MCIEAIVVVGNIVFTFGSCFSIGIKRITNSLATFPMYSITSLPFELGTNLCLVMCTYAHFNDIDILFLGIG